MGDETHVGRGVTAPDRSRQSGSQRRDVGCLVFCALLLACGFFFTHLIGPALELPKASGSPAFQSTIFIQASGSDTLGPGSSGSVHWFRS
jgi:hypothetical protein